MMLQTETFTKYYSLQLLISTCLKVHQGSGWIRIFFGLWEWLAKHLTDCCSEKHKHLLSEDIQHRAQNSVSEKPFKTPQLRKPHQTTKSTNNTSKPNKEYKQHCKTSLFQAVFSSFFPTASLFSSRFAR